MAPFDPTADLTQDLAYRLLVNSPVTLYRRPRILEQDTNWLAGRGYQIVRIDAARSRTELGFYDDIAAALEFPGYFGRNLDALNDCMRDVVTQEYGWKPDTTGLVIVFTGYHAAVAGWPRVAQIVLDIMADHSRAAALFGGRLLCLVQTDEPDARFEPVGGSHVQWNHAEWLDSHRRAD